MPGQATMARCWARYTCSLQDKCDVGSNVPMLAPSSPEDRSPGVDCILCRSVLRMACLISARPVTRSFFRRVTYGHGFRLECYPFPEDPLWQAPSASERRVHRQKHPVQKGGGSERKRRHHQVDRKFGPRRGMQERISETRTPSTIQPRYNPSQGVKDSVVTGETSDGALLDTVVKIPPSRCVRTPQVQRLKLKGPETKIDVHLPVRSTGRFCWKPVDDWQGGLP
ncbi:hypothetical protein BDZ85DRAFT_32800 [Elsinoe ampelina]|uniref:Uncharacterized protein n=1 Tax=Elsinoe ampelina TaxID=302913 RepID=A0A6A6G380_9PEZI|nr:hypothetical protein BDZ85DRAFT_32800 [Elsinoe ampelina]